MNDTLEKVCDLLKHKKFTLSTAESCTGGLLGAAFTEISGSSEYYLGGVISYDNSIKQQLLSVPHIILESYGAVSAQTVEAMARGVQHLCKTEYAISTSGIAGPGGGTPEKPVGLVFIGIAAGDSIKSYECHFKGDRQSIREQTVTMAIEKLLLIIDS